MKRLFWLLLLINIIFLGVNIMLFQRNDAPALLPEAAKGNITLLDEKNAVQPVEQQKGAAVETATPTKSTAPTASSEYKQL